ncbi:MAG: ISNCY family transposase [Actinobacteria bacterium]|nr:ISNCY family transposase [Actinomycetota bacterium]
MNFEDLLARQTRGELTQAEAASLLGMSERTFRRWRDRHEDGEGLQDRRIGKPSSRRADGLEIQRMLDLYRAEYADFTVKHFYEHVRQRLSFKLSYSTTKVYLQRSGLVAMAPRRGAHRRKRPRRPLPGMLLHQDASSHAWLPGNQGRHDLIATMDDATSEVYSLFLVDEEGTASTFQALTETIERKGLFCALYTDRGRHCFFTPKAGGRVSKGQLTEVGRALHELGIEHIAAYSPQARGRSERLFGTLQDRLPKEFRLAGIRTVEDANVWLREVYLERHNDRFAVAAEQPGTAFIIPPDGRWRDVLCVQQTRIVGNDNTVRWRNLTLQLPQSPLRPHFVKATVRVREYWDGSLSVTLGPHRLADFDATGTLINSKSDRVTPFDAILPGRSYLPRNANRADTSPAT